MKSKLQPVIFLGLLFSSAHFSSAQQQARVELFSPQGVVKQIRQVRVRFSEPMVPLGDPRSAVEPFEISCPEKGRGRWVDSRNWSYDFERDLPAGIRATFTVRQDLRSLSGNALTGTRQFAFSTGGPAILMSNPYEGSTVEEEQIFILKLDATPVESSVLSNVFFAVEGIASRVGVRIISGPERDEILKSQYPNRQKRDQPLILVQARQRFPNDRKVSLIWGRGVASVSGVTSANDQVLPFMTRSPFTASFVCQRENPQAKCVPITPMRVVFSAAVAWADAGKAILRGPNGKTWKPEAPRREEGETIVGQVTFKGPFPEKSEFEIEIPSGLKDDNGRTLSNAGKFPLTVHTDEYPPLAKFSADFGILEWKTRPVLPVTLRNIEPQAAARMLEVAEGEASIPEARDFSRTEEVAERMQGRIFRVPSERPAQIHQWIERIKERTWDHRERSILGGVESARIKSFTVPKLAGPKPFEVVGIPLPGPGFYVVEIQSEILGAALLGKPKPMYVPTTVLVTNLGVHFKWGIESSLVWVTTLDTAKPVAGADVQVRDCAGKLLWKGATDAQGAARVGNLPSDTDLPKCSRGQWEKVLLVSAQFKGDMAFVQSNWDEGIESWRFNLPTEWERSLVTAHTVFDRTLLRAGETVHMKHFLRRRITSGFGLVPAAELPKSVIVQHAGSDQRYELSVRWDANGTSESEWTIPREAKLGEYQVYFSATRKDLGGGRWAAGNFRVEQYRVPLMRGTLRPPAQLLVSPSEVPIDLHVGYLAGGGAPALRVRLRHQIQSRYVTPFEGFDEFVFSNGKVREGISRGLQEQEEGERDQGAQEQGEKVEVHSLDLTLDRTGSARATVTGLHKIEKPEEIWTELEFQDPNGEIQTVSSRIALWPADRVVGIRQDSWVSNKDALKFQAAVLDLAGKPVTDAPVRVDLFEHKTYSHRKRLVGGFYAYEHLSEVKRIKTACEGKTDRRGLLLCTTTSPVSGSIILEASTTDRAGRETRAHLEIWVAGKDEWWFRAGNDDRIDILPERKRYEPGQKARFQVRMPFRKATALITIEREGVGELLVKELSGKEPVVEIPVKGAYAPNIFVSVLVVRGRVGGVQPTALVDLGRPAFKLGIAEIKVGWKAHELNVKVTSDRQVYKVREKAKITVSVRAADGAPPPRGAEVALAAVDEGLLELMPNQSWQILAAMMGQRRYGVKTSTAQMHVIGKRHFGLKALPDGGGGGRQITRELFDTLLLWKGRVFLSDQGTGTVEVPLNDSITSFRIVAVASAATALFGTGSTAIRSTQDLMIFSGIAPVVRQGDSFRSTFTLRNASEKPVEVQVSARVKEIANSLKPESLHLASGESKEVAWTISVPLGVDALSYEVEAKSTDGLVDRMAVKQKAVPAVAVRPFQATLTQLEGDLRVPVERPGDALPDRGGLRVAFSPSLLGSLSGVEDYMRSYPYTCLEQEVSRAIVLHDRKGWQFLMSELPSFMDRDGLLKYFPACLYGTDELTAYVLAVAKEAGLEIPAALRDRMMAGLRAFVEGRVIRYSSLPTADLSIRKIAALEASSRYGGFDGRLLSSITIEPNLWPTSAVIDWFNIVERTPDLPDRAGRMQEAEQILRSRLNFQGTTMGFSTERRDFLWWLLVSTDGNAARALLSLMDSPAWREDIPRMARGALGRQLRGRWDTTVANAWGVLAMEKFSMAFEREPVSGTATASIGGRSQSLDWSSNPKGRVFDYAWPNQRAELTVRSGGTGKPWVTIQSLAAIPLKEPFSSGYRIEKAMAPVEQQAQGSWSKGDIIRVRLEIEAQSDMTWVVVNDPIPAGASILGTGLGRDSRLATRGEKREGWVWPVFEERSFEGLRSYYEYVPKGSFALEYTMRLNSEGAFQMPATRVEAMYSPEMLGEIPNETIRVSPGGDRK